MPAPIRTLFLDAVGTLFGLREAPGITYARFAAEHGIQVDPGHVSKTFIKAWKGSLDPDYSQAPDAARREAIDRAWWQAIVQQSLTEAGAKATDSAIATCFDAIFAHYGTVDPWHAFPDTLEVLPTIRQGHRLVVLSNFDQRLAHVMDGLGLTEHVDQTLYSSALGACKPNPTAFERALEISNSQKSETLHIGDDAETDGQGAARAGLRFFHLQRPEITLHDLARHLKAESTN